MFVINGTSTLKKVLMSPPTFLKQAAPINAISVQYADRLLDQKKMLKEYASLVSAYQAAGVEVVEQPAFADTPNAVFARDFGGCVREGYILGRFKKEIRLAERDNYEQKMLELGIPKIAEVTRGYFEGGDFAFIDETTIAIGQIDRSDAQGIEEIQTQLESYGYSVYAVPANPDYLHLDMCFNLVAPKIAIAYTAGLPDDFLALLDQKGIAVISGSEAMIYQHGYNVQALGNGRVLSLAQNKAINSVMYELGLEVIEVEITELLKAGGGIHCMTFPLERVAE